MLMYVARQKRNMTKFSQCSMNEALITLRNSVMSQVVDVLPSMLLNIDAINLTLERDNRARVMDERDTEESLLTSCTYGAYRG